MAHQRIVRQRQLARASAAGARWQSLLERRAGTVRRLRAGGPTSADRPDRVEQYRAREAAKQLAFARAGVAASYFNERKIGPTLDLDDYPPDEAARIAGLPVGRIVDVGDGGEAVDGFATGFLIAPGVVLTNHHVFENAGECRGCGIQFGYEHQDGQIVSGPVFGFEPARLFFTDDALDFTVVAVGAAPLGGGGTLDAFRVDHLTPALGKILVGQSISIIQYPDGGPKKYGVRDNELLVPAEPDEDFLQYTTDTLPGSSGSPAFNQDWEVVALHHSGVPEVKDGRIMTIDGKEWTRGMPDTDIHWVANEGVRVSKICAALIAAQVGDAQRDAWADLVQTFQEDFSMLPGVQAQPPAASAPLAPERGVSIVINGNANIYLAGGAPAVAVDRGAGVAAPVAPGVPEAPEKKLVFDPDYDHRPGYDEHFLKIAVPVPAVAAARSGELLEEGSHPRVLKYHHYSLVMNAARRLQMWSAVNVDYTPSKRRKTRAEFGAETWVADPRIPGNLQIEDQDLYDPAKKFDRGHIVRRDDTAWGETAQEEIFANSDSYHWTNCTPQHQQFNRAVGAFHGLWGQLENHIQKQAKNVGNRMSIFAGPILDAAKDIRHDFGGGDMLVPVRFWKVVLAAEDAGTAKARLRAYGFVLDQTTAIKKFGLEEFSAGEFEVYQVRLADITADAGVTFATLVAGADAMAGAPEEAARIRIDSLDKVRL
ncbi:MAG TPA: DNA/RNA non-specific endonuclease [Vicinamibacterales bacterium]|nr:DNA/RNA non-specific endonuclease [Vicinamibacterales bacterium]